MVLFFLNVALKKIFLGVANEKQNYVLYVSLMLLEMKYRNADEEKRTFIKQSSQEGILFDL